MAAVVNVKLKILAPAALAAVALAACSHSAPDASAVLRADGYSVWTVNGSPDAWASSQACGIGGSRAEEVVIVRSGSEAVARTAVSAVRSDRGSGLGVREDGNTVRVTGTVSAFTAAGLCRWRR